MQCHEGNACLQSCSAEVIKIEHPTRGDDTRAWGPPYASYTEQSGKQGSGESAYFIGVFPCRSSFLSVAPLIRESGQPQQEVFGSVVPA